MAGIEFIRTCTSLRKPIPVPSIVDDLVYLGVRYGRRRWRNADGTRYFEWDGLHGELEVYNRRGRHIGAFDPVTGVQLKPPRKGRRIDV
jgi:hypothetical protein